VGGVGGAVRFCEEELKGELARLEVCGGVVGKDAAEFVCTRNERKILWK
jgi:hypothetical protein